MTPALTEVLFALGLGDRVVGVTEFCNTPVEARAKPKIGGYANPSAEAILALRPQLVLVSPAAGNRDAALAVKRSGARLEVVPAERLEDTFAAIEIVARICGVKDRGEALGASIRSRLDRAVRRAAGRPRVRSMICLQTEPLIVAGPGTLPSELLRLAGGDNVVTEGHYPQIGLETVVRLAPEVIVQALMDTPDPGRRETALRFWSRWPSIPAVRSGRVHVVDATPALRPGPRVADAVDLFAGLLQASGSPPSR